MPRLGDLLLDTSVIIEHFGANREITASLEAADSVSVPAIVVGELYYGALRSTNFEKQERQLTVSLGHLNILSVDGQTAIEYGKIRAALATLLALRSQKTTFAPVSLELSGVSRVPEPIRQQVI